MIGIADILDMEDTSICLVCGTDRTPRAGKVITMPGRKLWVCKDHAEAFSAGRSVGNIDLSTKMVDTLARIQDEDTGFKVKERVFDLIPTSRQRVMFAGKGAQIRSPQSIYREIDKIVVGQEEAKRAISVSVYEHLARAHDPRAAKAAENTREKRHVLFIGPSGSGKTLLAQTVASAIRVPFTEADATSFSPAGFYGADFDSVVMDLFSKAANSTYAAERGAVFIDEFDKLASGVEGGGGRSENMSSATQNTLLKLIDGKRVKMGQAPPFMAEMMGMPEPPSVSTNNVLFMFGGAFPGIIEKVAKIRGIQGRTVGFRQPSAETVTYEDGMRNYELLLSARPEQLYDALIEYGLSAELMGRIPVVVPLRPLNREELRSYLMDTPQSPLKYQKTLFDASGHELEFTDDAIDSLLDQAVKYATGTRSLSSMVRRAVGNAAFKYCGGNSGKSVKVTISAATTQNAADFEITRLVKLKNSEKSDDNHQDQPHYWNPDSASASSDDEGVEED